MEWKLYTVPGYALALYIRFRHHGRMFLLPREAPPGASRDPGRW